MQIQALAIPDVKIIIPKKFGDERGYFSETYNKQALADAGIEESFVQDNQSLSATRGTVQGLHFRFHPSPRPSWSGYCAAASWMSPSTCAAAHLHTANMSQR